MPDSGRKTYALRIGLSADRTQAIWRKGDWGMTCPVTDLPKWQGIYSGFARKRPENYARDLAAIEAVMRRADIPVEG